MKKLVNIIVIIAIIAYILFPTTTVKAESKTLQDYKNEVASLKSKKDYNNQLTNSAIASIDAKRNAIVEANNTIEANEETVEQSKTKVIESEEQIKIKTEELKDVINILQYTEINQDELYMDYVFTATSIPDMMQREAVVAQIADYTQSELESLEQLIDENKALQVKLAEDNVTLTNSISNYEQQVKELEKYIDSLATIGMDYDEQIAAQENLIRLFEEAGCSNTDSVDDCYYNKKTGSKYFSRPLVSGIVTQEWSSYSGGHKGIDIGGNAPGTYVYAPADGTVIRVAYRQSCGGNEIYMHHTVNGVAYTTEFAHLRSINVQNGEYVRKGQVIATVGGDSSTWWYDKCTSGAHLHYSIAYGYWLGSGYYGYSSWYTFTSNTKAVNVESISNIRNAYYWRFYDRG